MHRERLAWDAERSQLVSELGALRKKLNPEGHDGLRAQTPSGHLGERHVAASQPPDDSAPATPQAPSRTLLQADPQCSAAELLSVQADPVAAVTAMFTTNFDCAMCLVPCASAADALDCAMGCLKQDEGGCTAVDLAALKAVGMPSSLADRAQLVQMMEVTAHACVRCIVETIASVCGVDCVPERLHLVTDYIYSPRPCLPELAARISVGEASAFERAVAANEPFGLTIGAQAGSATMSDLFVPIVGSLQARKTYRGVDSGMLAYECDPMVHGRMWALRAEPYATADTAAADAIGASATANSTSLEDASWASCSGELRIDLESGQVHSQSADADYSSRPIRFNLQWAGCSTFLPFLDRIGPSTCVKTLDGGAAQSRAAACWLSRFFGSQAHRPGPPSFAIELAGTSIALETDLVVRSGTTLRLVSSAHTTVVIGPHQIRVESGAWLELDGLTLADSVQSSALVVRGSVAALRTTFVRCEATTNMIMGGLMETLVPDGVGAFLAAVGAAVHITLSASMEIVDSALLECSVGGAKVGAGGGAIFVDSKAQLVVVRSELRRNSVAGGAFGCVGGALWVHIGANATVRDSVISANVLNDKDAFQKQNVNANVARGGSTLTAGGAAFVMINAHMTVHQTEVCDNLASSAGEFVTGGGFYVHTSGQLAVSASLLCRNQVENNGLGGAGGGAISAFAGSRVTVKQTVLHSNTARGGLNTYGGSCHIGQSSEAYFFQAKFVGNSVGSALFKNEGGAIALDPGARFRMRDSELRNNSANGIRPSGGAIWSAAESAVLVNTSLLENRVVASAVQGQGGAVSVAAGSLRLIGCRVHDNVAESLRGSVVVLGGAFHLTAGNVSIEASSLKGNRMGGLGLSQAVVSRMNGGAHVVAEGGDFVLDSCSVAENGESGEEARMENAAEWWLYAFHTIALRNSSFRSATLGQGLLNIPGSQLQLMIRGCAFENARIGVAAGVSAQPIGVVDSTFTPALDPSVATVQPTSGSGTCAAQLAGERLCDARALCEGVTSGVRCACVGSGLRSKSGVPDDGRLCEQDASMRAVLESESVVITVAKPGSLTNRTLTLIVEARGEAELNITFNVTITRFEASSGAVVASNGSMHIDQPSVSAFGQHIEWKQPPPTATWLADLDGGRLKYVDTLRHEFSVRLACDRGEPSCAADGDVITTTLQLASPHIRLISQEVTVPVVTVQTRVEALVSCNNTVAWVTSAGLALEGGTILAESPLEVRLQARDVDDLEVRFTRAEILLHLEDENKRVSTFPFNTKVGSSDYTCAVAGASTEVSGRYTLVVRVPKGPTGGCEILRRSVMVAAKPQGLNVLWLSVGSLSACTIFVGAIVVWARRMSAELRNVLVMVLTETSKTVISISFELGDLATDVLTTYRVVFLNIVRSPQYRVPYAVFGCLSIVVALISLAHHVHRVRELRARIKTRINIQPNPADAHLEDSEDDEDDAGKAVVSKLEWELEKTSRDLKGLVVGMLCFFLEDVPMVSVRRRPCSNG